MENQNTIPEAHEKLRWSEIGLVSALGLLIALGWYGFSSADSSLPVFYVDWSHGSDADSGRTADMALKTVEAATRQLTNTEISERSAKIVIIGNYPAAIELAELGTIELTGFTGDGVPTLDGSKNADLAAPALIKATNVADLYVHNLTLTPSDLVWPVVEVAMLADAQNKVRFENNIVQGWEALRLVNANETLTTARLAVEIRSNDFEMPVGEGVSEYPLIHDFVITGLQTKDLQVDMTIENNVFSKKTATSLPLIELDQTYGEASLQGNQFITNDTTDTLQDMFALGEGYLTEVDPLSVNQIGFITQ